MVYTCSPCAAHVLQQTIIIIMCGPLGYVQGMSDLLAPILYVVDNEVDAFWCFAGLMERMVRQLNPKMNVCNVVCAVRRCVILN